MNLDLNIVLGILIQFAQLAGIAALIAAIVQVAKYFGWVKDGYSGAVFAALNLIVIGLLIGFRLFVPTVGIEFLDEQAAIAAEILLILLGYLVQLKVGSGTAQTLIAMELPVLGATHDEPDTLK